MRWATVAVVALLAAAAALAPAALAAEYTKLGQQDDPFTWVTEDAVIIESAATARGARGARQSWPGVLPAGPCFSTQGRLGQCTSFRACYPFFKLPDFSTWETWVLGVFDTCSYFGESGRQMFGVCCTDPQGSRPPSGIASAPAVIPVAPAEPQPAPAAPAPGPQPVPDDSGSESGSPSNPVPDNWPPPIPTHPPEMLTHPPLPTHPPLLGAPTLKPPMAEAPRPTTAKPVKPRPPPVVQPVVVQPAPPSQPAIPPNWPPPLPTHPPASSPATLAPWPPVQQPTAKPPTKPTAKPPTAKPPAVKPPTAAPPTVAPEPMDASCGAKNGYQDQERIVGGQNADLGEWPWIAALFNGGRQFCGGSLIDSTHILSAAHCVAHMSSWDVARLTVRLGDHNIRTNTETRHIEKKVRRVVRHRGFDSRTLYNDVAILTMDSPVQYQRDVRPICLPHGAAAYAGKTATVIGWGSLRESGPQPAVLQEVNIPVWTNAECRQKYGNAAPGGIVDTFLCAGQASRDSCSGDSGGPLMVNDGRWTQVGVVSWGIGCGKGQYPGVYTRVTSFMPWIQKNLK